MPRQSIRAIYLIIFVGIFFSAVAGNRPALALSKKEKENHQLLLHKLMECQAYHSLRYAAYANSQDNTNPVAQDNLAKALEFQVIIKGVGEWHLNEKGMRSLKKAQKQITHMIANEFDPRGGGRIERLFSPKMQEHVEGCKIIRQTIQAELTKNR